MNFICSFIVQLLIFSGLKTICASSKSQTEILFNVPGLKNSSHAQKSLNKTISTNNKTKVAESGFCASLLENYSSIFDQAFWSQAGLWDICEEFKLSCNEQDYCCGSIKSLKNETDDFSPRYYWNNGVEIRIKSIYLDAERLLSSARKINSSAQVSCYAVQNLPVRLSDEEHVKICQICGKLLKNHQSASVQNEDEILPMLDCTLAQACREALHSLGWQRRRHRDVICCHLVEKLTGEVCGLPKMCEREELCKSGFFILIENKSNFANQTITDSSGKKLNPSNSQQVGKSRTCHFDWTVPANNEETFYSSMRMQLQLIERGACLMSNGNNCVSDSPVDFSLLDVDPGMKSANVTSATEAMEVEKLNGFTRHLCASRADLAHSSVVNSRLEEDRKDSNENSGRSRSSSLYDHIQNFVESSQIELGDQYSQMGDLIQKHAPWLVAVVLVLILFFTGTRKFIYASYRRGYGTRTTKRDEPQSRPQGNFPSTNLPFGAMASQNPQPSIEKRNHFSPQTVSKPTVSTEVRQNPLNLSTGSRDANGELEFDKKYGSARRKLFQGPEQSLKFSQSCQQEEMEVEQSQQFTAGHNSGTMNRCLGFSPVSHVEAMDTEESQFTVDMSSPGASPKQFTVPVHQNFRPQGTHIEVMDVEESVSSIYKYV